MKNTSEKPITYEIPYHISTIMPQNLDGIMRALPHRLYANHLGDWLEIQTELVDGTILGEKRSGVIVGVRYSSSKQQGYTYSYYIDRGGKIYMVDSYAGMRKAFMDVELLYLLLNPLSEMNMWKLHDVAEAQKEHTFDTNLAVGMKTAWGYTTTFHPDLEDTMSRVRSIVESQL